MTSQVMERVEDRKTPKTRKPFLANWGVPASYIVGSSTTMGSDDDTCTTDPRTKDNDT